MFATNAIFAISTCDLTRMYILDSPKCKDILQIPQQCIPYMKVHICDCCRWGAGKERRALSAYQSTQTQTHHDFKLEKTGLHVNPNWPHLGASPDGLISCSCCGFGTVEVKVSLCSIVKHFKRCFPL